MIPPVTGWLRIAGAPWSSLTRRCSGAMRGTAKCEVALPRTAGTAGSALVDQAYRYARLGAAALAFSSCLQLW